MLGFGLLATQLPGWKWLKYEIDSCVDCSMCMIESALDLFFRGVL